jgi:ubiquinone/menaquinone biosynthesis C-methylase UbiE
MQSPNISANKTDVEWERWGQQDPYYGVLTDGKFRSALMNDDARSIFFKSGEAHTDRVLAECSRLTRAPFRPARILDFGCGVGRLVIPFARTAEEVVGVDVSPSMLAEARRNCDARGIGNVHLGGSDDTLSTLSGTFELVHTSIVLQHIPQDRGRVLFRSLVRLVSPGGVGALHLTFADSRKVDGFGCASPAEPAPPPRSPVRRLKDLVRTLLRLNRTIAVPLASASTDPEMEMHFYNFSELLFMLSREGIDRCTADFTDHGGALGAMIYFVKPGSRSLNRPGYRGGPLG